MKLILSFCMICLFVGCASVSRTSQSESRFQKRLVGGDRDEHGCLGTAGYTWCEVQKDCIRLFEKGIRLVATDESARSAYIVFAPDSTCAEIFFSGGAPNEILQRHRLSSGEYVWNVDDDDTKCIRFANEKWAISQRGRLLFQEK